VVLAREKGRYIRGLTAYRADGVHEWIEQFAAATAQAARLAARYAARVQALQESWRERLRRAPKPPRQHAAAWVVVDVLPAHPIITIPVGVAATGRTRPAVANAIAELERAGVLHPVTTSPRNRAWEADGLLDLVVALEAGEP
jgi:Fic family protein